MSYNSIYKKAFKIFTEANRESKVSILNIYIEFEVFSKNYTNLTDKELIMHFNLSAIDNEGILSTYGTPLEQRYYSFKSVWMD